MNDRFLYGAVFCLGFACGVLTFDVFLSWKS